MVPIVLFVLMAASFERVDADLKALDAKLAAMTSTASLEDMVKADTFVRQQFFSPPERGYSEAETKYFLKRLDGRIVAVDKRNTAALKKMLRKVDWFTVGKYGAKADEQAWLLVQHSDLDVEFQKRVLKKLEPLAAVKQTDPKNFAFLYDRVATNEGKPQRYGTQGECAGPGAWKHNPLLEPSRVDELRAKVGLEPLSEYVAANGKGCT